MHARWYAAKLQAALARPYVNLVFGARQTGKSTLVRSLLPPETAVFDLAEPGLRTRLLARPGEFTAEVRALPTGATVFVDEAQNVPAVFDAVQHLFDTDRERWHFVLCGSSARRLRKLGANLLPGRSLLHRLHPLTLAERPAPESQVGGDVAPIDAPPGERFPAADLLTRLAWGELPGVATAAPEDRAALLKAYAVLHLEEEIRREGMVRDWGAFARFLHLAASESGSITNYAAIAREAGVAEPTVKSHYQLLEDMFIGVSVPAWSGSPRKNLLSTPRFYLFDAGVRHAAAGLSPGPGVVLANPGPVFEGWVAMELARRLHYTGGRLHHLRTRDGGEVDLVVEHADEVIPVEVKWTEHPDRADARHLLRFLADHPTRARRARIICRCARRMEVADRVTAVPWWAL
jgi:predicted AAA+ superfamily ATPase